VNLESLLKEGLAPVDSRDCPGVQLADVVAGVLRRAALSPDDQVAQVTFRILKQRRWFAEPFGLRFFSDQDFGREDLSRYSHLL
jgi:hypothetical protein